MCLLKQSNLKKREKKNDLSNLHQVCVFRNESIEKRLNFASFTSTTNAPVSLFSHILHGYNLNGFTKAKMPYHNNKMKLINNFDVFINVYKQLLVLFLSIVYFWGRGLRVKKNKKEIRFY